MKRIPASIVRLDGISIELLQSISDHRTTSKFILWKMFPGGEQSVLIYFKIIVGTNISHTKDPPIP